MSYAVVIQAAVEAYQKYSDYTDKQNFIAWQSDVSTQLSKIRDTLAEILQGIGRLQESIDLLPAKFEEMLNTDDAAAVTGWTSVAMETAREIKSNGLALFNNDRLAELRFIDKNLAAAQMKLEAKWFYTAHGICVLAFLARAGLYRIIAIKEPIQAGNAFDGAKEHILAWLDAGIGGTSDHKGPGRVLEEKTAWNRNAAAVFDPLEHNRGLRLGWYEFDKDGALSSSGAPTNKHLKLSQPRLVGSRDVGFRADDMWERDSKALLGPTPQWGDLVENPWLPSRLLNGYDTNINNAGYGFRNESLAHLYKATLQYKANVSPIAILEALVADMVAAATQIRRLTLEYEQPKDAAKLELRAKEFSTRNRN
ncbi:hypothetical protein [Variovorax sp. LjRoot178]|uniref:hypothetical protein n=1 Tax=Variovorax sp. LjRoot178 TaxID=3342277 RepID=UPI003ECD7687